MSFQGVQTNKAQGGLIRGGGTDRVAAFVSGCGETDKLSHFTPYELLQIEDAEALGIDAACDAAGETLTHYHLSETFRLSPETRIFLIAVPVATKVSDLKTLPAFVAALRSIDGINTIAAAGLTADADITAAIAGAQILADNFAGEHIYIDSLLIEGHGGYLAGTIATMPDLRQIDSPNVSVIIAQDPGKAAELPAYAGHGAVGSALGMLMVRAAHENLGSVDIEKKPRSRMIEDNYPLTDARLGLWVNAALSNGKPFSELSFADQTKLDELGYIYAGKFNGYGGFYFSNSHTCTGAGSDYAFIERNAVWNKATRIIRNTLIPRIRSKVEADSSTGYIKSTTIASWDGLVRKALKAMTTAQNVADFDIYIDPNQLAVSNAPFKIRVRLVADGVVHEFEVDLGFTNKI
ncbi:MAG: DUF2586 domain-containing protein [Bacteroidales bacterium]|jgi:hypothetical protein|nr:DUF2586 domain-containing protein [Bacteroidales bacterium]